MAKKTCFVPDLGVPPDTLTTRLLAWYARDGRDLPWRVKGGQADPYRVWLSEVMLQQTTVATVKPYYEAFLARWPTVAALAAAPLDDVLTQWAGLGYYARARNLHACAQKVAERGAFPGTEAELRRLPGIGAYTAAAVAAIAFGQRAVVVDGNVERVMARLFAITEPLPGARPCLDTLAAHLTPADPALAGDYAQAVMDLGATLCTPRSPACGLCPWRDPCAGRRQGIEESVPAKAAKPEKPTRRGVAFWAERPDGSLLLRRRPAQGLLGGMMEVPSTEWRPEPWTPADAIPHAPLAADWRLIPGRVRHTFTHFHLELDVMAARVSANAHVAGVWVAPSALKDHALPTVMKRIIHLALTRKERE
ncbi:A/G-specific adenine glycosylase [Pararhodospirillum photometricum]|uniref:Adenine DNA glycosylase n=1 Tax=Pararhodospirillum photometricum DSM 122 TaxID=1150469 RepID=H6SLA1_PARPM|nr:A/G-specific adenine glycosylase [Pararhodospirillum photometricum]CCG08766.1 A/G-specific DNA-adenine glycosylase [Pararhodospirillum photometricum DSM 122]